MAEGRANDIITTIGAVLGLVSTAAAAFGAWQALRANKEAEAAKNAAMSAQTAFAESKYQDEKQFALYEKIEKLLHESAAGSLVLAATYVSLVKDPDAKATWCSAVLAYARIRGKDLTPDERGAVSAAKECVIAASEQKKEEQQIVASVTTPAAATPPAVTSAASEAPANPPPATVVAAGGNPLGFDIDVFACEAKGSDSHSAAEKIAKQLAEAADQNHKLGDASLGRIRLRTLSRAKGATGGYPIDSNQVQADSDPAETALADLLAGFAKQASGRTFVRGHSSSGTAYYLSVFACGAAQ